MFIPIMFILDRRLKQSKRKDSTTSKVESFVIYILRD